MSAARPLRFALPLFPYDRWGGVDALAEAARLADDAGFGALELPDHVVMPVRPGADPVSAVWYDGFVLAAHLAAHTTRPVIGVPLAASDLKGLDSLLATAQMPAGIPVATVAIGKMGAANAGWLAASILSVSDAGLASKLAAEREAMERKVAEKSERARASLDPRPAG